MFIKKLSEKIIKQIAAGEVIQKPYNAIKEIIENSIDAKSTKIDIYFQNYSLESIILIDNGIGFEKEDLLLATQLHTTSKTKETDNMFGNNFLGFRGEALSSIDAISYLTIESNSNKLINNQIYPSNFQSGTKLTIKNIFQKIPARLKFIKNPQFEFKLIKELIKKYIINYENISWNIFHNDRNIYNFKESTKKERITKLFKEEPIIIEQDYITAYILKQNINISIIFANNRPIKDKAITRYIISLLKEYTFIHEDIGYILFINIDNILIDYNVHPSKEEVKFFNYQDIFKTLYKIFAMENLAHKISNNPKFLINKASLNSENTQNIIFEDHISSSLKLDIPYKEQSQLNLSNTINSCPIESQSNNSSITINPFFQSNETNLNEGFIKKTFVNESEFSINNSMNDDLKEHYKIIGQIKNSFILFETNEGIGFFDQHAAHERIIYEDLKKQMQESNSQNLLTSIKLNLTAEQEEFLIENEHILIKKGFILTKNELFSIPFLNKKINFKAFFETLDPSSDIQTELDRLLANIACKQAIKANHELSTHEMKTLLKTALKQPPICNHGRPVFKYFSNNEILNFFKR